MNSQIFIPGIFFVISHVIWSPVYAKTPNEIPNIVLILADDVALMDFGIYGGEANTPNIDSLAQNGTLFTNYHASPMCAPSRAMLLTGLDSHRTGVPNLPLFLPQGYATRKGYEGILNDTVKTLGTLMQERGFQTYMIGKWHLGHSESTLPHRRGFDRTFVLDASGADNWEHKAYLPGQSKPPWYKDGQPVTLPDDFYSSKFLVDQLIEFMKEETNTSSPFFAFLSFQAIHIPVQAPREFTKNYEGVYNKGWSDLRKKRFEKAKELGLIPQEARLGDMLDVMNNWDDLSPKEQNLHAKSMAVNAGMLEAMDHHIGRFITYLQESGKRDNTIFIVTSDNGPEASDPSLITGMGLWLRLNGYTRNLNSLGEKGSYVYIGPEFASAAASPSAFFKFYAGEGGLRVPLIMSGPGIPEGKKQNAFSFITDITPTILHLTGPEESHNFNGKSLVPLLDGTEEYVYGPEEYIGMEAAGQCALFRASMKLVRNNRPYGDGQWRLYNVADDPGETRDLAMAMPEVFSELREAYRHYAQSFGVIEMPDDYEAVKEVQIKYIRKLKRQIIPWAVAALLMTGAWLAFRRRKRYLKTGVY